MDTISFYFNFKTSECFSYISLCSISSYAWGNADTVKIKKAICIVSDPLKYLNTAKGSQFFIINKVNGRNIEY